MDEVDLDQTRLRKRQVEVLTRALSQFVTLKSSGEGWVPVAPAVGRWTPHTVAGGDVNVQMGKRTVVDSTNKQSDIYRMTASIPLDPGVSRDTQGPFSAYLSELRDWQAVLECPGIRSMWNYFLSSSSTLEMLDANTTITRSILRSPVPGRTKEFAHQRDLLTVETSLVDPTTVVYISTSLPTTPDDPAYLREEPPFKRVHSDLWAWCVEIATPMDAVSMTPQSRNIGGSESLLRRNKPRVCVQVTCFMHLDLGSWKSQNALACSAAAYLIPSLVAHLRLLGAPPRLARIGPSISIDRRDWCRSNSGEILTTSAPTWVVAYSVMANCGLCSPGPEQPQPVAEQPIIARILDLETSSSSNNSVPMPSTGGIASSPPMHTRKVSSLSSYLSSSLRRRQGEAAALGTHGGGIVRDGEEVALVATRARLGDSMVEFVVDASRWHIEGFSVDIQLEVTGNSCGIQRFFAAVTKMQAAAPELFTGSQLGFSLDEFLATHPGDSPGRRRSAKQGWERGVLAELAGRLLVRCFSIASQQSSKRRYLVRIMNPPAGVSTSVGDQDLYESAADRAYSVSVSVRKSSQANQDGEAGLRVNGHTVEVTPFSLDPTTTVSKSHSSRSSTVPPTNSYPRSTPTARSDTPTSVVAGVTSTPLGLTPAPDVGSSDTLVCEGSRRGSSATTSAYVIASETPEAATDGEAGRSQADVAMQAVPLIRLHQASQVPVAQWRSVGMAATGGITISRIDLSATYNATHIQTEDPQPVSVSRSSSASVDSSTDGTAAALLVPAEHRIDGTVLRAEASVEGWTVFDVFSALSLGGSHMGKVSGLWASARQVEQVSANAAVHYYRSAGTWATSARDAVVCRSWSSNQRSRIEVAECSVDALPYDLPAIDNIGSAVRADLGLSAWVLEKSTHQQPAVEAGSSGRMSLRMLTSIGDLGPRTDDVRLRSGSLTTGSAAMDAEFENQRRKQHVVRIMHYVKYNPGGWMDRVAELADQTAAVVGAGESAAVTKDITQLVNHLDAYGAQPAAVWTRNAHAMSTDVEPDSVCFSYRLATWGAPPRRQTTGSSAASSYRQTPSVGGPMAANDEVEFVEAEFRIEHRVWAHGTRADGTERGAANVEVVVEPFYAESTRVACFVDPEADPHATRVRVRHHRAQLLPRVEEEEGAMVMAWPTVRVSIVRKLSPSKANEPVGHRASSLVAPQRTGSPLMLPWSVPPRVAVNSVAVRVRYLRRDDSVRGFYARCQSVSATEAPRLARDSPAVGGLFIERLPEPLPSTVRPPVSQPSIRSSYRHGSTATAAQSQLVIQNYTVIHGPLGDSRLVTPIQFARAMRHVFADIRHQIERLDMQSPRARWEQLAAASDVRSNASLRTAIAADDSGWSRRSSGEFCEVFERMDSRLHTDIPVTVAVDVLQGVSARHVAQVLYGRAWDDVLFAERRTLEHVSGAVDICYALVHTPPFCDKRDALTVATFEQAPFLSARQRMRNWQQQVKGCSAGLGDYADPAFTLVEASVPGSQPLATATRAQVALYAVRIEPIDAYERVSSARNYAHPACRVTVACCVDLAGNVPLTLRRAASARIPESHIAQIAALCRLPLDPYVVAPSLYPILMPNGNRRREYVAAEATEELVDGLPVVFYRTMDGSQVVCESNDGFVTTVTRDMIGKARECLRNSGQSSGPEDLPRVLVICDIVVDSSLRGCFAVSVQGSEIESPIIDTHAIPCGVWVGGRLAVYVFTLGSHYLVRTTLVEDNEDNDVTCTVAIRPSSDGITVNGQCMRVHQALPPSQSLLFVVGDSSCVLHACRECGNVACAADAPPGTLPPVAYASDESSEDEEEEDPPVRAGLGLGPILRSSRNSSCNIDSGHLMPRSQSPPPIAVQSVLRQRTGHVSLQRTSMESSSLDDKSGGTSLAARAALALVSLAVFLPIRRLVIGGNTTTVGRWLLARTNTLPMDYGGPKKSVLALIVLVMTAVVAVTLGVALAGRCWM
ncbi:hypothetical protein GGH94_003899 [Coemansia aciculifera]|uniref:START domain-containing protein n=1 Tax=Coemansia aciculifera TaxID=417176 RepID=A0A9W8IPK2_9FUNG|nr:hypothetical protein GGH94_003899 [Coemansia aciculifera]